MIILLIVLEKKMRSTVQVKNFLVITILHFLNVTFECKPFYIFENKTIFNFTEEDFSKRVNYVQVSGNKEYWYREDLLWPSDPRCFFQPDVVKCYNLHFVLQTIIGYRLDWIDAIYIEDTEGVQGKIDHIDLSRNIPKSLYRIVINCKTKLCLYKSLFEIRFKTYQMHLLIVVKNLIFKDTNIVLYNVNVYFTNVQFINTTITDMPSSNPPPIYQDLMLTLSDIKFFGSTSGEHLNELKLTQSRHITLKIADSLLHNFNIHLEAPNIWTVLSDTRFTIQESKIIIYGYTQNFASFINVTLCDQTHNHVPLEINSRQLHVEMLDSTVENTVGSVLIQKDDGGLAESWLKVNIINSTFINNTKFGIGGALSIIYFVPSVKQANFINISGTTFINNRSFRFGVTSSYGGAIAVKTEPRTHSERVILHVQITDCYFLNNHAENGGGAIYTSKYYNYISIMQSRFEVTEGTDFMTFKSVFIESNSDISLIESTFICQMETREPLLKLKMVEDTSAVKSLDISVACLPWHMLTSAYDFQISPETGHFILHSYEINCRPCKSQYYVLTDGIYRIYYLQNASKVTITEQNGQFNNLECVDCPYGGQCPGNILQSKPNYWGYKFGSHIIFEQCPTDYCCTGTDVSPCTSYNNCIGNRTGTLCGECKEGYSASIASSVCVVDEECGVSWLAPVAILAVSGYMLWYTFKDDILGFPSFLINKICRKNDDQSDSDGVDKGYFGIMTYFVQAAGMMRLSLDLGTIDTSTTTVQEIEKYIGLLLSIELSYISYNFCPYEGATTMIRLFFKFMFLIGIYISWAIIFPLFVLISNIIQSLLKHKSNNNVIAIKLRFIKGLVEIIKYTYGGFTGIVFTSIICITIGDDYVWQYDGTVSCLSKWQIGMLVTCIIYTVPFPFVLMLGMKLLEKNQISSTHFLVGCIVPLPVIFIWPIIFCTKKTVIKETKVSPVDEGEISTQEEHENGTFLSTATEEILGSFQGAYVTNKTASQYWESVMTFRRLLLGVTSLLQNSIIQMSSCLFLCVIFLAHQMYVQPFVYRGANMAESFSLLLLCAVATLNLLKSMYIKMGIVPDGPDMKVFHFLRFGESLLIILLIIFIILLEFRNKCKRCKK